MPINTLTGSGPDRINEIQSRWLVMEPNSYEKLYQNPLYTVPLGQTFGAEVVINSGSVTFTSGTLEIKKDIHIFESETEAAKFIEETGAENISSIIERVAFREDGSSYVITEVHLLNHSQVKFFFDLLNANLEHGFKIEVFASSSNGLQEIQRKPVFNARGDLISDTFLKYFDIEVDSE